MDFIKNLLSKAKEAVTNVFSSPSSNAASPLGASEQMQSLPTFVSSQPNYIQSLTGGVTTVAGKYQTPPNYVPPASVQTINTPAGSYQTAPQSTIQQYNVPTQNQPALKGPAAGGSIVQQVSQPQSNQPQFSTTPGVNNSAYFNSLNPMQQAAATRTAGFVDPISGQYVAQTGYSGLSGQSQSFSPSYFGGIANQGAVTGSAGAGGSAYTGLLTASGGLNTPSIPGLSSEIDEEKRRQDEAARARQQRIQGVPSPYVAAPLSPSAVAPMPNETPLTPPAATTSFAAESLGNQGNQIAAASLSGLGDVGITREQVISNFNNYKSQIEAQNPTPQNPVVYDEAQTTLVESSPDQFGVKALLDEYKAQNTNLAQLETQKLDTLKSIQALNQAYTPIIDEIKNNPNLPKSLSARRINQVQSAQKEALTGFLNQLELLNQSISTQNEAVNRAFNIVQFAQSSAEKEQARQRDNLKLFIDTGAIGAMSDAELANWASKSGFTTDSLKAVRASAKDPDVKTELVGSSTGGYSLVTYGKDGTVSKTTQVVAPTATAGTVAGGGSIQNLNPESPTYIVDVLAASKGGKAPSVEERRSLNKLFTVTSQIQALNNAITGEMTGPILGAIRSANPFDTKAQTIQRQLTAIVPNLARGVFGEVGVLTDNDVALYSRTLAGLKDTTDVNKAVQAVTIKTVQRSLEDQLQTLAASGIDVSGFKNQYNSVKNTVDGIETQLASKASSTGGQVTQTGKTSSGLGYKIIQ